MSNYKILQHFHGLTFHINYEKPELVHSSLESSALTFSDKDDDFHIQEISALIRHIFTRHKPAAFASYLHTRVYKHGVISK